MSLFSYMSGKTCLLMTPCSHLVLPFTDWVCVLLSVFYCEARQVFACLFVLVDLFAAEFCLWTKYHIGIFRLLQAKLHFEVVVEFPLNIYLAVLAWGIWRQVFGLVSQSISQALLPALFGWAGGRSRTVVALCGWGVGCVLDFAKNSILHLSLKNRFVITLLLTCNKLSSWLHWRLSLANIFIALACLDTCIIC